jgi:predicted lipid-binding transport protein (Tim44 family)
VLQLDATVVDVATEDGQQVVSVRFWGLVREQSEHAAQDFDEIWHLVKAGEGWLIAGIQQTA